MRQVPRNLDPGGPIQPPSVITSRYPHHRMSASYRSRPFHWPRPDPRNRLCSRLGSSDSSLPLRGDPRLHYGRLGRPRSIAMRSSCRRSPSSRRLSPYHPEFRRPQEGPSVVCDLSRRGWAWIGLHSGWGWPPPLTCQVAMLHRTVSVYKRLIIDEIGYLPLARTGQPVLPGRRQALRERRDDPDSSP